jgi:hypothetical protein
MNKRVLFLPWFGNVVNKAKGGCRKSFGLLMAKKPGWSQRRIEEARMEPKKDCAKDARGAASQRYPFASGEFGISFRKTFSSLFIKVNKKACLVAPASL